MTVGVINNWVDLGVTGRVDVDSLTVGGVAVTPNILPSAPPEAADSPGVAGTITWDATHLYVCVATDTWVRADLTTWA